MIRLPGYCYIAEFRYANANNAYKRGITKTHRPHCPVGHCSIIILHNSYNNQINISKIKHIKHWLSLYQDLLYTHQAYKLYLIGQCSQDEGYVGNIISVENNCLISYPI